MKGRVSKIKTADSRLIINIIEGEGTITEREVTLKSAEDPHPDLTKAFRALEQHAREILEWPASYAQGRVSITGVSFSFSEKTEVEGAVMTGQVALQAADAPLCFNTPHLPFDQYTPDGCAKLMPEEAVEALMALRVEAMRFVQGKRLQGDLFREDTSDGAGDRRPAAAKVPVANLAAVVAKAIDEAMAPARNAIQAAADRAEARSQGKAAP